MATFYKQQHEEIADLISTLPLPERANVGDTHISPEMLRWAISKHFADWLGKDNRNFDRERFFRVTKGESDAPS